MYDVYNSFVEILKVLNSKITHINILLSKRY